EVVSRNCGYMWAVSPAACSAGCFLRSLFWTPLAFALCAPAGCAGDCHIFGSKKPVEGPAAPADSMVLRGDKLIPENAPVTDGSAPSDLASAHELYRNGDYEKAEKVFRKVAENTKNSATLAGEGRYYEAECLRRQAKYPRAADTYNRM